MSGHDTLTLEDLTARDYQECKTAVLGLIAGTLGRDPSEP